MTHAAAGKTSVTSSAIWIGAGQGVVERFRAARQRSRELADLARSMTTAGIGRETGVKV